MSAYVIAQLSIHDRARYDRYAAAVMPTLKAFAGRLLAADDSPTVAEGEWPRDRVVLLAFPDAPTALAWAASPAYRAIAPERLASTDGVVLVAKGLSA